MMSDDALIDDLVGFKLEHDDKVAELEHGSDDGRGHMSAAEQDSITELKEIMMSMKMTVDSLERRPAKVEFDSAQMKKAEGVVVVVQGDEPALGHVAA